MNKYFNINDKVYDVTEKYPETIGVFVANGFEQLANDNMRKLMGKTISLEMALKSKKINIDTFCKKLIGAIEENRKSVDDTLVYKTENEEKDIRIDGVLPCPVRVPLLDVFNKWMEEEGSKLDYTVDYELKAAAGGRDWLIENIKNAESEDELSDLFMSAGFDLFFDKKLMGKFKERGTFEDITAFDKLNSDFQNEYINLQDPKGEYTVIGVVPAVFLVNTEELGDREMPRTWEDILKPEFENSVSLPVGDFDLFNAMLLTLYKEYGEEGIRKLGKSMLKSMHPSEMVKSHMKSVRPAVTVMPYFFTKMTKRGGPMVAVWPEDGAIISPIFLLSKKSKKDKLKPFVDLFASEEVGEILSHNGRFPSTNPNVDNGIPSEQKYLWLGWDFIEDHNIGDLIIKCENIFNEWVEE